MTETEWLDCTDPEPMLWYLGSKEIERKLRLCVSACSHRVWDLLDKRVREWVETNEQLANGLAIASGLEVRWGLTKLSAQDAVSVLKIMASKAADARSPDWDEESAEFPLQERKHDDAEYEEWKWQCSLLRDIFGNPFRPPAVSDPCWLAWSDRTVVKIAQRMYDERNFADMPILADALEDAGCENEEILRHCREPGEHVRGCCVVDLLLDKK